MLCHRVTTLLNGTGKKELWDKILRFISTRCKAFLSEIGYVKNAVPFNYTSEPPKDILIVRHNLAIVESLIQTDLNVTRDTPSSNDQRDFGSFLETVAMESYAEIDPFIEDVTVILSDEWRNMCVTNEKWKTFEFHDLILSADVTSRLSSDLEYLREMKRMDEDFGRKRSDRTLEKQNCFDVGAAAVPISGLAMSKVCRLEVEMRTVLELWDRPEGTA